MMADLPQWFERELRRAGIWPCAVSGPRGVTFAVTLSDDEADCVMAAARTAGKPVDVWMAEQVARAAPGAG